MTPRIHILRQKTKIKFQFEILNLCKDFEFNLNMINIKNIIIINNSYVQQLKQQYK